MEAFDEDTDALALPSRSQGVIEACEFAVHRSRKVSLRHVQRLVVEMMQNEVDGDAQIGEEVSGRGIGEKWCIVEN